jgi:hypothetical protein
VSMKRGSYFCDRCGRKLPGDGIFAAANVSTLDENGDFVRLQLCNDYLVDQAPVTGCAKIVLTPEVLASWTGRL